jgi:hypothetical protein
MNSTSYDWQPSTVGDVAARSMRQPIDDIADGGLHGMPGRAGTSSSVRSTAKSLASQSR